VSTICIGKVQLGSNWRGPVTPGGALDRKSAFAVTPDSATLILGFGDAFDFVESTCEGVGT